MNDPLYERFLENAPEETWGLARFDVSPRDHEQTSSRFVRAAIGEAMAEVRDVIETAGGSHYTLGRSILAGFSRSRPLNENAAMQQLNTVLTGDSAGGGIFSTVQRFAPMAPVATTLAAGLLGPAGLLTQLGSAPQLFSAVHAPAQSLLPSPQAVQGMLREPMQPPEHTRPAHSHARQRAAHTRLQQERRELHELQEAFVNERSQPGGANWSQDLRERAERIDEHLREAMASAPIADVPRLRSMVEFADAILEVVEEPRPGLAHSGLHSGLATYGAHPAFDEPVIMQHGPDGTLRFHDPRHFERPQHFHETPLEVAYGADTVSYSSGESALQRGRTNDGREQGGRAR